MTTDRAAGTPVVCSYVGDSTPGLCKPVKLHPCDRPAVGTAGRWTPKPYCEVHLPPARWLAETPMRRGPNLRTLRLRLEELLPGVSREGIADLEAEIDEAMEAREALVAERASDERRRAGLSPAQRLTLEMTDRGIPG